MTKKLKKSDDELFRSAILEAKQVKKTALANAKLAIEEAFRPHLTKQWSESLNEEAEDGYDVNPDSVADAPSPSGQKVLDTSGIGDGDNKQPRDAAKSTSNIDNPGQEQEPMGEGAEVDSDGHDEVLDQLDEDSDDDLKIDLGDDDDDDDSDDDDVNIDIDADSPDAGSDDDDVNINVDLDDDPTDQGGDLDLGDDDDDDDLDHDDDDLDDDDDDLDLESLIRELERDVRDNEDDMDYDEYEDGHRRREDEDITEPARRDNATQTVDMVPDLPPAVPGREPEHSRAPEINDEDLEEILREMELDGSDGQDDAVEAMSAQIAELKHGLKESRNIISFLKSRLTEVNMLNAKLLYTNKLFKEYNLKNDDKLRIYETFDRVSTIREAKLLYTTLAEVYAAGAPKRKKVQKRVMESVASMSVGSSTKPKSVLNESKKVGPTEDEKLAQRMRILSGIVPQGSEL